MVQRAALWAAAHESDEKPPTEVHKTMQDGRRLDPNYFMEECLPVIMGLLSPTPPGMALGVPRRECFWCGWPATAREVHCFRCGDEIDVPWGRADSGQMQLT